MTRHAKNATASTVYTYSEKRKDSKQSGYGTQNVRLSKDSIKEFDCCSLTLQPCKDPVMTPDGYLYDKEVILEYIVHQRRENERKLKEYEKYKKRTENEKQEVADAEQRTKVERFLAREGGALSMKAPDDDQPSISNMAGKKKAMLNNFWAPACTPDPLEEGMKKPSDKVLCPMTGKPIKFKDLIPVKFTHIKDDGKTSLIAKKVRYVCPVTNDTLSNSVPCAVLRTSGNVVTMEAVEKFIKKDMVDPITGVKLKESDIIVLQRGATGFASAGATELQAQKAGPAMHV